MPYCWDGLDNAARITDTRLWRGSAALQMDGPRARLDHRAAAGGQENGQAPPVLSRHMQKAKGTDKAADLILKVTEKAA